MIKRTEKVLGYEVDVVPNEYGGHYARIPDFPTMFTGGATREEAMRNAKEAIELMIEEQRRNRERSSR